MQSFVKVDFEWACGINSRGGELKADEYFVFLEDDKITNLELYVGEVIDRILKEPYFDERPQHTNPSIGY